MTMTQLNTEMIIRVRGAVIIITEGKTRPYKYMGVIFYATYPKQAYLNIQINSK